MVVKAAIYRDFFHSGSSLAILKAGNRYIHNIHPLPEDTGHSSLTGS